ncbi:MAG: hypothetical protein ACLVEU_00525 [Bacteroides cellulosilyticus]
MKSRISIRAMGVTLRYGWRRPTRKLNIEKLRYHKVIIMTDADVDGSSHRHADLDASSSAVLPAVIEQRISVYLATPPLYLCKKGKVEEYCWTDQQRQQFIDKYGGGNENADPYTTIQRFGRNERPNSCGSTTMNPENRMLKQISIENAAEVDYIFSMLMGEDVGPRRDFIEKNATYANIDA